MLKEIFQFNKEFFQILTYQSWDQFFLKVILHLISIQEKKKEIFAENFYLNFNKLLQILPSKTFYSNVNIYIFFLSANGRFKFFTGNEES